MKMTWIPPLRKQAGIMFTPIHSGKYKIGRGRSVTGKDLHCCVIYNKTKLETIYIGDSGQQAGLRAQIPKPDWMQIPAQPVVM